MKITDQEICEYLFDLLEPEMKIEVQSAIESDPQVKKEYVRLKSKFDRLKLLEPEYPNPLIALSHILMKHSAVAAILILTFSLWFLPNKVHAESPSVLVESSYKVHSVTKVCCTSGISPEKAPRFDKNFDEILAKNLQVTSSIDTEMNYSTQYLKKLSL